MDDTFMDSRYFSLNGENRRIDIFFYKNAWINVIFIQIKG